MALESEVGTPPGFEAFLQVDGIDGESQDKGHEKWIEVLSYSWGVTQTANNQGRSSNAAGKVNFQDLTFTKSVNTSSPKLMQACATGQHIKKAVLTCRKAGSDQQDFLKITLSDLLVSSFVEGGHGQTEAEPTPGEQISFNFSKIEFSFSAQSPDGQLEPPTIGGAALGNAN